MLDINRQKALRKSLQIERVLDDSGAGAVLVQPEIDSVVAQLVEYKNPLRANLPRKPGSGQSWLLNRRSAPGTTPAEWVADTGTTVEDNGTYARVTFTYRTLLAEGRVTRKLQAEGATYTDILADEMEARVNDVADTEENALLIGNNTGNTAQPDGLCVLIPVGQCVMTTDQTGGEAMTLADLDELVDTCRYNPDMLIMSKRSRRQINALLQSDQQFVNMVEVQGGFKVMSYNQIPIYISTRMVDTKNFNGAIHTAETGGSNSEIYAVDSEHTWVGELTPITMAPLARTSSQFDAFHIYEDIVLVVRDAAANAKLIGIL